MFPSTAELDQALSEPTAGVLKSLAQLPGDVLVLGVAGKMGVTLARMARRALDQLGRRDQVVGVARFSAPAAAAELAAHGVQTVACDLLDRAAVRRLPDAPNVIFMAGQKFGTAHAPEQAWAANTLMPALVAERFGHARIVAFSTGCVYPLVPASSGGSREEDALGPPGDYANSCVGRERIFTYYSQKQGTPLALFRLNYAVEMRYGVLLDVALKIWRGEPVDVTMGHANVIWQRDANAFALQCLAQAASPPFILNVTGPELLSIRAVAERLAQLLGRDAKIIGQEAPTAWLNNASRAHRLFGPPTANADQLIEWTADWVKRGGATLGKPTHFEVRDGKF
jgi:nucleoside-diphosphate-sugar epimerase